ncbi:hypothetical protein [Brevundimonas sp.]|uniref:hypothetical protein n=1 Tax=Brevundimonas sp. TaxID=1871086 RepID=UPI00356991A2
MKFRKGLREDVESFSFSNSDIRPLDRLWFDGYRAYLGYFADLKFEPDVSLREHGALAMAWSWMGRAPFGDTRAHYNEAATAIRVMRFSEPTVEHLESVAIWSGNSMVGASKFLHFLLPDKFAVWDSRVAREAYAIAGTNYSKRRKAESYLQYLKDLPSLKPAIASRRFLEDQAGPLSDLRVAELTIFMMDRRNDTKRKAAEAAKRA